MPGIIERIRQAFEPRLIVYQSNPEQNPVADGLTPRYLYATQENLYAVVSFLAASVAQLPLKVYVRDGETERRRDRTSTAARLLWKPNGDQTAYEFFEALTTEILLFGQTTVWVMPDADSDSGYQLRIIPKEWIADERNVTAYAPSAIVVKTTNSGKQIVIPREEFVMFRMYAPGNPSGYQSPIAALRRTLSEQMQAAKFRAELWRSSGRFNAYLTRPANVAAWDDEQRQKFVQAFRKSWRAGGEKAGSMPLLEDGMEIKSYQFNAKEAQYAETKQLSREDVASAYHVNPALIWHTGTQTYASAKDNARALYAECLGPTLQMIQQRLNSFLLPMIGAEEGTYVEFDLNEKLKGSFEERASIMQSSVGGPWLTRNEARADQNLPPVSGGDELIVPLNVLTGGQASPTDTHMDALSAEPAVKTIAPACRCVKREETQKTAEIQRVKSMSTAEEDEKMAAVLSAFFARQRQSVLPKIGAKAARWWDQHRWDTELADDIEPLINEVSDAHGEEVASALGSTYNPAQTRNYLRMLAEGRAAAINEGTYKKLRESLDSEDEEYTPAHVFELREGKEADLLGRSLALTVAGWAATHEAPQQAEQNGVRKTVEKMWVTGDNPRLEHALMDGETVPIWEPFSNGLMWPGDDDGDPDETCGCNCSTEIIIST